MHSSLEKESHRTSILNLVNDDHNCSVMYIQNQHYHMCSLVNDILIMLFLIYHRKFFYLSIKLNPNFNQLNIHSL